MFPSVQPFCSISHLLVVLPLQVATRSCQPGVGCKHGLPLARSQLRQQGLGAVDGGGAAKIVHDLPGRMVGVGHHCDVVLCPGAEEGEGGQLVD